MIRKEYIEKRRKELGKVLRDIRNLGLKRDLLKFKIDDLEVKKVALEFEIGRRIEEIG